MRGQASRASDEIIQRAQTDGPASAHGHERVAIALVPSCGAVHRVMACPVAGSTMKYCQYAACLTRVHHAKEFLGTFALTISYSESIGPTPNSHLRVS